MNAAAFDAVLAEVGTEWLWRTNPVLCIDRLLVRWNQSDAGWAASAGRVGNVISTLTQQGIPLPTNALNRWVAHGCVPSGATAVAMTERPAPRIIGMAVDAAGERGYVFPLCPTLK